MAELPLCFGTIEVLRPQSRAENCCDDCPHEVRCRRGHAMASLIAQDADLIDSPLVAAMRYEADRAEQAAELAKWKALAETLAGALERMQWYGCPVCNGDCAGANPPVLSCPMQQCTQALTSYKEQRDD